MGILNAFILPFLHGINSNVDVGGLHYQTEFNALFLNCTALLSVYYFFSVQRQKIKALLLLVYISSISIGIIAGSRAAFLSFFLAIIIYYTIATIKKFDIAFRRKLLYFFICYFLLLIADALLHMFGPITKFYTQLPNNYSIYSRLNIWFAQILMFLDKPFFGWGFDCFKYVNTPYQIKSMEILKLPFNNFGNFIWGHNELLQILCEGGIFFTIFLIYLFYKYFKVVIKSLDKQNTILFMVIVMFIVQSMFSWPLRNPTLVFVFVSVMALLYPVHNKMETGKNKLNLIPYFAVMLLFTYFIITFGWTIVQEVIYIPKIEKSLKLRDYEKLFKSLNTLSHNQYLVYEANHHIVYLGLQFITKDIFKTDIIPDTKEAYNKIDEEKLFNYDKMNLVDFLYRRAEIANNLRPFSIYVYSMAFFQIVKGNYEKAYNLALEAEKLQPGENSILYLMHFANVLKAAKNTGKPVTDFLPSEESVKLLENLKENPFKNDVFEKK